MAVNRDFAKNYVLGGGEAYIKFPNDDNFQYFGATEDVKLNFKIDKIEHQNSEGAMLVTDLELTKAVSADITIQTADLNPKVLAFAFSGDYTETSQDAATDEEVDFGAVEANKIYEVGKYKIKNVSVTYKDGDDDVEATEGVDYSVDYQFGTIEIAENGSLVGKDIKVHFDNDAYTTGHFSSLNETSKEVAFRFISKPMHGKPSKTDIFRTILSLDGDFALKSAADVQKITLKGKVLKDETRKEGEQFLKKEVLI
jgi:hypothetical protein